MLNGKKAWPLVAGALVVALLAAGWGPAALGADDPPPAVGTPQRGDAVRYSVTEAHGGSARAWELVFTWSGVDERRDRMGVARPVDVVEGGLVLDADAGTGIPFEIAYPAGGVAPVTFAANYSRARGDPAVALPTAWSSAHSYRFYGGFPGWWALCAVRAGWQGMPLDEVAGRPLGAHCPGATSHGATAGVVRDAGEATVDGRAARGFTATLVDHRSGRSVDLALWFVPGLPYPVEVRIATGHGAAGEDTVQTLRLAGFRPGDAPLLPPEAPSLPAPRERRDVAFGAPGRWGVVEGDPGVYAFPPSEAAESLTTDPTLVEFRDYLASHPDARVVEARYYERLVYTDAGGVRRAYWEFLFNDPAGEGWSVTAWKTLGLEAAAGSVPLPAQPVNNEQGAAEALPPLDPAAVPARVVSMGDALAAWMADSGAYGGDTTPFVHLYALLQPEAVDGRLAARRAGSLLEEGFTPGEDIVIGHRTYRAGVSADDVAEGDMAYNYTAAGRSLDMETGAYALDVGFQYGWTRGLVAAGDAPSGGEGRGLAPVPGVSVEGVVYPAAVGATILALVAYYFGSALKGLVARFAGAPLYTRLSRADVLENPLRRRILRQVRREPGVHVRGLQRRVGCGNGALLYHLDVLAREGLVTRVEQDGYTRFYVSGDMPHGEMERAAALKAGSHRRVYDAIVAAPGRTQTDVAEQLGVSVPAVHYVVKKLERAGLVRRERRGRRVGLFAVEE